MNTNESHELYQAFVRLCGTRTTMEEAKSLPTRLRAGLAWQGELTDFVIRFPQVLSTGVQHLVAEDERESLTLDAYGVRQ